jgi:uncharacterized membrane protein
LKAVAYWILKLKAVNTLENEIAAEPIQMQQLLSVGVMSLAITALLATTFSFILKEVIASPVVLVWLSVMGLIVLKNYFFGHVEKILAS